MDLQRNFVLQALNLEKITKKQNNPLSVTLFKELQVHSLQNLQASPPVLAEHPYVNTFAVSSPPHIIMAISAEDWAAQQATWNEWVKALLEENFSKVTVIVRPHNMENGQPHPYAWSPLAYSAADCVATQWEKTDADGNKTMVCLHYNCFGPYIYHVIKGRVI